MTFVLFINDVDLLLNCLVLILCLSIHSLSSVIAPVTLRNL